MQCMSQAFHLSLDDEETKKRLSIKPLTLPKAFDMGMQVLSAAGVSRKGGDPRTEEEVPNGQQALPDQTARQHLNDGTSSSETPRPAHIAPPPAFFANQGLPDENRLLDKFLATLTSRGFFQGLVEGTQAYSDRLDKAKAKFKEKFAGASQTDMETPKSGISSAPQSTGGLRDRMAHESQKMEQAEAFKMQGNSFLADKRFADAVNSYTRAISLCPTNAVYYSNRAAAYTHLAKYDDAIADCRHAIELKPDFSKAYSRLGTAHFQVSGTRRV